MTHPTSNPPATREVFPRGKFVSLLSDNLRTKALLLTSAVGLTFNPEPAEAQLLKGYEIQSVMKIIHPRDMKDLPAGYELIPGIGDPNKPLQPSTRVNIEGLVPNKENFIFIGYECRPHPSNHSVSNVCLRLHDAKFKNHPGNDPYFTSAFPELALKGDFYEKFTIIPKSTVIGISCFPRDDDYVYIKRIMLWHRLLTPPWLEQQPDFLRKNGTSAKAEVEKIAVKTKTRSL